MHNTIDEDDIVKDAEWRPGLWG